MHLKVRIASVVTASVALGQSSLLQSSVKKHSKVLVVLDRASELFHSVRKSLMKKLARK